MLIEKDSHLEESIELKIPELLICYHPASVLTPSFIEMLNYPKLHKELDGIETPVEEIFEREFLNDSYTDYLESSSVQPGADIEPKYHLKANPISFAKDNMQFKIWSLRTFMRVLRKLPFEVYTGGKRPFQSELAVEVDINDSLSICPYHKKDRVSYIDHYGISELHFDKASKDWIKFSYSTDFIPGSAKPEPQFFELQLPSEMKMPPRVEDKPGSIDVKIYFKHNPEIVSREAERMVRDCDVRRHLEQMGGYAQLKNGRKLVAWNRSR